MFTENLQLPINQSAYQKLDVYFSALHSISIIKLLHNIPHLPYKCTDFLLDYGTFTMQPLKYTSTVLASDTHEIILLQYYAVIIYCREFTWVGIIIYQIIEFVR